MQQIKHEKKKKKQRENAEVKDHLVFVYFDVDVDVEAREDTANHIANLLCTETDQKDVQFTSWGESCAEELIRWIQKGVKALSWLPMLVHFLVCYSFMPSAMYIFRRKLEKLIYLVRTTPPLLQELRSANETKSTLLLCYTGAASQSYS